VRKTAGAREKKEKLVGERAGNEDHRNAKRTKVLLQVSIARRGKRQGAGKKLEKRILAREEQARQVERGME